MRHAVSKEEVETDWGRYLTSNSGFHTHAQACAHIHELVTHKMQKRKNEQKKLPLSRPSFSPSIVLFPNLTLTTTSGKKRPLFPCHGQTETQVQNCARSPREYTAELELAHKSARAPSRWVFKQECGANRHVSWHGGGS